MMFKDKILYVMCLLLACNVSMANEADCLATLNKRVIKEAAKKGLKDEIGIHWTDPIKKGKDKSGSEIYEYSTGTFIRDGGTEDDEGLIPNSGAVAEVIKKGKSCTVKTIKVDVGNF